MRNESLKKLVVAALFAAMTCIATMIIKIPTPTMGYIHLGDGFVLLCGILLGPLTGGLAAGIGSMFSDIFSGYVSFAPATLIIKAFTAGVAGLLYHRLHLAFHFQKGRYAAIVIGGVIGEAVMVIGYFLYEVGLAAFGSGTLSSASLAAGIASSLTGVPFNIVQGVVGILLSVLLVPILSNIADIREWMTA